MDIRELRPENAETLWRLRLEALEREPYAFAMSPEEHRETTVDSMRAILADSSGDAFVVGLFVEGDLRGMVGFMRERRIKLRHKGMIWGVYVSPAARGTGGGGAMMRKCLERASSIEGLRQVKLGVAEVNTAARALYESCGFEVYGKERGSLVVNGELVTELHMVRVLR